MKKHNIFITLEGGEGSGKSTVSKLIKEKFELEGQDVLLTREPGGSDLPLGESIRDIIMSNPDIDPITELLLFNASRREHMVKKIIPALNQGKLVISDRFSDSTIVYQGLCKGVSRYDVDSSNNLAIQKENPRFVFILDVDPKIGLERINENGRETNRFDLESIEFHEKVRQGYLSLSHESDKYIVIDATKDPKEIRDLIMEIIKKDGN